MDLLKILKEINKEFSADGFDLGYIITIEGKSIATTTYYHTYIIEKDEQTKEKHWKLLSTTEFTWP